VQVVNISCYKFITRTDREALKADSYAARGYPPMPVMVKAPMHPGRCCRPNPVRSAAGRSMHGSGICALHVDEAGRLQGFALTGSETSRRAALAKELAA